MSQLTASNPISNPRLSDVFRIIAYTNIYKILFVFSFFLSFQLAFSQDNIEIPYPSDLNNFGLNDSLVIETNYEIDYSIIDSLLNTGNKRILVIPKIVTDFIPDSLWHIFCVYGDVEEIDTNIFSLKFEDLEFDTEYSLIIDSLVTGTSSTFSIDTVITSFFTTQDFPPYIQNINNKVALKCGDTLKIKFWGGLDTTLFPIQTFAQLYKIDSVALNGTKDTTWIPFDTTYNPISIDSAYIYYISDVPHTYRTIVIFNNSYDEVEKELKIWLTNGFDYTKDYELKLNISQYTADFGNDLSAKFYFKEEGFINIDSKTLDTNKYLPEDLKFKNTNIDFIYDFDDTLKIYAPKNSGDSIIFYKWESNIDEYDGLRANEFEIVKSCEDIEDIELTAIYIFPCIDTISINYDTNYVGIDVKGFKDSVAFNKYTLLKSPYDSITILPYPLDISREITDISINSLSYTDVNNDNIIVVNGEDPGLDTEDPCDDETGEDGEEIEIDIDVEELTSSTCTEFEFCIYIHKEQDDYLFFEDELNETINFYGISNWDIFDNYMFKCLTYNVPPYEKTFNLNGQITNNCYEITRWYSSDGQKSFGGSFQSFNENFTLKSIDEICSMNIHIFVKRKIVNLEVKLITTTNKMPRINFSKYIDMRKYDEIGQFVTKYGYYSIEQGNEWLHYWTYIYKYPCGTQAEWYPIVDEDFKIWKYGRYICGHELSPPEDYVDCSSINQPFEDFNNITMNSYKKIIYEFDREKFYLDFIEVPVPYKENLYKKYLVRGSEASVNEFENVSELPKNIPTGMQTTKSEVLPVYVHSAITEIVNYDDYPMPYTNIQLFPNIISELWLSDPNMNGVDKSPVNTYYESMSKYDILRSYLYHKNFPTIFFHFSDDVNLSSLENKNLTFSEFSIGTDNINQREDLRYNREYEFIESVNGFEESNGKIGMHLFTQNNNGNSYYKELNRVFACHMDNMKINVSSLISREIDGEHLSNPIKDYVFRTETPDLAVINKHIWVNKGHDNCGFSSKIDICGHMHSVLVHKNNNQYYIKELTSIQETFSIHHIEDYHNQHSALGKFYRQMLKTNGELKLETDYAFAFNIIDEGSNSEITNSLSLVNNKLTTFYNNNFLASSDLKTLDRVIKESVSSKMKGWPCYSETRGRYTFFGTSEYNWSPIPGNKIYLYGFPANIPISYKKWRFDDFGYYIYDMNDYLDLEFWWILGDFND